MAIQVSCPGCKKTFNVDDKFAGKTGPCPHCKAKITVPEKKPEVKVHAPEDFGPAKGVTGKSVLKPIERKQTRITPAIAGAIGGGIVAAIVYAIIVRMVPVKPETEILRYILCGLGLLLVAPPAAVIAYAFLREDELEPYRGLPLWIRATICGAVYALLWGGFAYVRVSLFGGDTIPTPMWLVIVPPFFIVGGMAGKFSLDLETANGFFHYAFYVVVTFLLGLIAGVSSAIWQVTGSL
jgi:hypothetical protein